MAIFHIRKDNLVPIKEKTIDLEKDLQNLTEKNLQIVFGLEFVRTEFGLHNLYIDTWAFDPESKSFVIIEYKRDRSFSVVDQGYAYLALMLNNKADFILEYNEREKGHLKRGDVDCS
jgi:RecB family endonuclease NucS